MCRPIAAKSTDPAEEEKSLHHGKRETKNEGGEDGAFVRRGREGERWVLLGPVDSGILTEYAPRCSCRCALKILCLIDSAGDEDAIGYRALQRDTVCFR